MLELRGVTKQYLYGARLFGALDLSVAEGETLAVLGAEGSGKTSLLKTIAGVEPSEGQILLDGSLMKLKTDDVIMLFDDGAVFKFRTVFDNLAYPLKLRKLDKKVIAERVVSVADKLGIGACLPLRARSLSPLEKRKMSVARLFLRDAKLLLIDGLTAGLDGKDARELFDCVSRLLYDCKDGATVLYATSEPAEAIAIGDRILVLANGDVKQVGTAKEIYFTPDTVWSAQALDPDYNFRKAVLSCENGSVKLTLDFGAKQLVVDATSRKEEIAPSYMGREVLVGWHPADVTDSGVTERVTYSEGRADGYILETESGVRVQRKCKAETVTYSPEADKITLFDAATENSIMRRVKARG